MHFVLRALWAVNHNTQGRYWLWTLATIHTKKSITVKYNVYNWLEVLENFVAILNYSAIILGMEA